MEEEIIKISDIFNSYLSLEGEESRKTYIKRFRGDSLLFEGSCSRCIATDGECHVFWGVIFPNIKTRLFLIKNMNYVLLKNGDSDLLLLKKEKKEEKRNIDFDTVLKKKKPNFIDDGEFLTSTEELNRLAFRDY